MKKIRILCLVLALPVAATPALGQRWGGSVPASRSAHPARSQPAAAHSAATTLIDGRQPLWGGSPPQTRENRQARQTVFSPYYVVPAAVAAPQAVAAPVIIGTGDPATANSSYQMPVVTADRAPRELTTIEVYRLQPRFQKP